MAPVGVDLLFSSFVAFSVLRTSMGQYPPEFNNMVSLVQGLYDNKAQVNDDIAKGLPVKLRHQRLTTSLKAETIPFLSGKRNFYMEQYRNGNESDISLQRVVSFGIDPYTLAMQEKIYKLADPDKFIHAKTNDSRFAILKPDDVVDDEGCDVFWYQGEGTPIMFQSWMRKTCNVTFKGDQVLMMMSNNLTASYMTSWQQWLARNGTILFSQPSPYNMTRLNVTSSSRDFLH